MRAALSLSSVNSMGEIIMTITAVLFDLDGTLLPMDQKAFTMDYLGRLSKYMVPYGYDARELAKAVWDGTGFMINNDGTKRNDEVFWESFEGKFDGRYKDDMEIFDEFYRTDFQNVKHTCGFDPKAADTVRKLKKDGFRVILATNPIFPPLATESRIKWAGLQPEDFELYTTYENSYFCKPNQGYYKEILDKCNLKAEECIMVGNDVSDDMSAVKLGMKVFLLTKYLINRYDEDISVYPNGDFDDLMKYIYENK
ncbi:MAG: HAD family hydrolase [Anaerofustis stercorihominis]|nr:HAD family hydrolase [Anaerofustis stercorihominis]